MQLDNIIYDYQSFQTAIATQLNKESETFKSIYPSDTATSLVNVMASYGSMLQYQLVSAMANAYTDTAYSEAGIHQLAETLGNRLHGNISSVVYCNIERTNLMGIDNIIIPEGSKFTIGDLNFFNTNTIIFPRNKNILEDIQLMQGELKTAEFTSAGESGEKIYFCDDFKCNTDMVKVYVDGEQWDITDTFLPYVVIEETQAGKADVVILRTDPDGRSYIKFGNGTNGKIAVAGKKITIEYVSNEGANGNINTNELNIQLVTPLYYEVNGSRVQLQVTIYPTSPASGGFNTQSLDVLRQSSPYVFASGDRAVRRSDYKAMLLNKCGYLTCNVWGEYEEAMLNGGYDKIMMNMVYYTGIKSIQKYDLQPVANPYLSLAQINSDSSKFFPIDSNIYSARGFLGSYIIDIISYNADNMEVKVKYRDAQGNGILTCDPSINSTLVLPSSSQSDNFSDNFEKQIFNVNDFSDFLNDSLNVISVNQYEDPDDPMQSFAEDLITGTYRTSSGKNQGGQNLLINFDNPFQIRFNLNNRESITAFAFKTPTNSLDNFIGKFAIYGTNESTNVVGYDNIKNNSKWIKLTGVQSFSGVDLSLDSYTDWVTTNVYSPGTSTRKEEIFSAQSLRNGGTALLITELTDVENLSYLVKINGLTQATNTYEIKWVYNQALDVPQDELWLQFLRQTPIDPASVVLYGTANDWIKYQNYVIEVYSILDSSQKNPSKVALQQIKAIYKDSSSTIDYTDNNAISLNIPLIEKNGTKTFGLPDAMEYYEYNIKLDKVTETNGYKTNDMLVFQTVTDDGFTYTFRIKIKNINTDPISTNITVEKSYDPNQTTILRGKSAINLSDVDFTTSHGETITSGVGGKLTISSTSSVNVYGSYTGNYYLDKDIQSIDLPIINKYNHFTTYLEFKQPRIKNIAIEVNVEYENVTTYLTTKAKIKEAINNQFNLQPYSIGKSLNVSDLWKAINAIDGISRFNIITPTDNIDCMPYELIVLPAENLTINDIINSEYNK